MAKHLVSTSADSKKKRNRKKAKALPKLMKWRAPARRRFCYVRVFSLSEMIPVLAAVVLFVAACLAPINPLLRLIAFIVTAIVAGFSVLQRSFRRVLNREWPDEDLLLLLASLLTFLSGHHALAALLVILGRVAEFVESYVLARSARGVDTIREYLPVKAHVEEEFGLIDILPENIEVGDILSVQNGETIPVDCLILEGSGAIDSSAFGGQEAQPVKPGDEILSGGILSGDTLRVRALCGFHDSALARHLKCLESAEDQKTDLEDRMEFFSSIYTLIMLFIAFVVGVLAPLFHGNWESGLLKAGIVLVLASPSSLVLSVPVIFLGGLSCASHSGFRFRSKQVMENLFRAKTMVFGKTGTITDGKYSISEIVSSKVSEQELLRLAAAAEGHSRHPIAMAIKEAAGWTEKMSESVLNVEDIPGRGVSAFIEGKHVYVGNATLLEEHGIWFQVPSRSGAAIHVAVENVYWGHILLNDKIREGAFDAIEEIRSQGVRNIVLLTGDVRSATSKLARSLNFDMVKTDLTPTEKISAVSYLRKSLGKGESLAYVGDGFHDADMFENADVGIALNAMGDEQAEDAADVILMDDDILRVPAVMRIVFDIARLLQENVILLGGSKLLLLILALSGLLSLLPAMLIHVLCTALACLNALRSFTID